MFFALKGEHFNGNEFAPEAIEKGAKYVIIDAPEFNNNDHTILVPNVLEALQELATFHRAYLNVPILALTGSNGKTTTKELINAVLAKSYKTTATVGNWNNHIGVPLTLLSMTKDTEIGIVEMGANHQKEIEFLCRIAKPDFGYITNFGKAHLEGFGGVEGVIKGKSEMYQYLIANNKTIFVNSDDPIQVEKTQSANTINFGTKHNVNHSTIVLKNADPFVVVDIENITIQSQLIGTYNFSNISAAIAIGKYFKVPINKIKLAIEEYAPQNNRSQIIIKGTTKIILDAYNANPTSMSAALTNFNNQKHPNKIVILGDMFELGDEAPKEHKAIKTMVETLDLKKRILIGENFFHTNNNTEAIDFYESFDTFRKAVNPIDFENAFLLIKGSRGMALERVLTLIEKS